jgi:outer membrane receptor for ferrienterochelin and colicins
LRFYNKTSIKLIVYQKIILLKLITLLLLTGMTAQAQSALKGKVAERDESMNMDMPIVGANVYWSGTTNGVVTNSNGDFSIELPATLPAKLVVSFVGYQSDTLTIADNSFRKIVLKKSIDLKQSTLFRSNPLPKSL